MDNITEIMEALQLPFAYDHFAEGEGPDPPFICFLLPGSDNFAADGRVYFKATMVHIELYTNLKDPELEQRVVIFLQQPLIFFGALLFGAPVGFFRLQFLHSGHQILSS